ncbi:MAG TPA: aminomethyl-transferring glycine dehydrogenase, partial [Casimicrobiaceae bacterium]
MSGKPALRALEAHDEFVARHIGTSTAAQDAMLREIGFASRAALMNAVVPPSIRLASALPLPAPSSEAEALAKLRRMASKNRVLQSFIGQGYYGTHTPGVIQRSVFENPAWYTAYTPYQPEISQGRLEALLNFQTMIADLTGMEIANASMLDEATAAAEAMTLCQRAGTSRSRTFFVAADVFPQTIDVVRTRAAPLGIDVVTGPASDATSVDAFGVLLQYPGADGDVRHYRGQVDALHARNALVVVAADLLALTLLAPPGEWGADVVVGSSQRFGVPMGYGGPHAGYMATRDAFKRALPGRLVGVTVDAAGAPAYRLALQTREQHIRREKATSNICTAQVLLAVMASMYAVYHGAEGLTAIARRVHRLTAILREGLLRLGFEVPTSSFFDTLVVATNASTQAIVARALAAGCNLRLRDAASLGISLDETTTRDDVGMLWRIFAGRNVDFDVDEIDAAVDDGYLPALARTSPFLTHPVFRTNRSETRMLRYLRRLADKDLALDRTMIPLGSCTMKLNATSEMLPVTWPQFCALHPFAPADQAQGYRELVDDLERMLCAVTGYDAVSLQPNAGSQGEYAGLLMIHAYHASRGEAHRDVCLIPASAHGTNPASAKLAGMKVVVVGCDRDGNVDLADLEAKAAQHRDRLAAIMVTYPSTHGVFETGIGHVCDIVHAHGGQVYVDGANLNALVGLAAPGKFGADVSHLNLHKTFCIPHGGGGPGVGPVACKEHLAAFLPGHRYLGRPNPVSAAPYGSASILPISWMYITMMGASGLRDATESAILAANYVAKRLAPHYPVLYSGPDGLVAHECILDLRPLKALAGVEVEDVAKRLIDYGFHAPTMSFPVAGTLMVEPTESEPAGELDRFVAAMIAIRDEVRAIERGAHDRDDNPLKHAPHTAAAVTSDAWTHAY